MDCNEYRKTLIDARMIFMELSSKEVSFMTYILRTIAMVIIASLFLGLVYCPINNLP